MIDMFALGAVGSEFEPRLGQTEDYEIGIYCYAKHAASRSDVKDWLA